MHCHAELWVDGSTVAVADSFSAVIHARRIGWSQRAEVSASDAKSEIALPNENSVLMEISPRPYCLSDFDHPADRELPHASF
jgi:hypothetical protein